MKTHSTFVLCLCLLMCREARTSAAPVTIESGMIRLSLVELYTSEGCSSCPQADSWLSGLLSSPGLWTKFVPVAFHVDYWDHLGWSDRFAKSSFSQRQRLYASDWRIDSVYTPAVVRDGKEWRGWRLRQEPASNSGTRAGVLRAVSTNGVSWKVDYVPSSAEDRGRLEAHLVLLGFDLNSSVQAGENEGRSLRHDFVVLSEGETSLKGDQTSMQGRITIPAGPKLGAKRLAVALWVGRAGSRETLQAAGGWLPPGMTAQ